MLLEAYMSDSFYDKKYQVGCNIEDPNDLAEAISEISLFIAYRGIPTKSWIWACRRFDNDYMWHVYVTFTLTLDQLMNMKDPL